VVVLAKNAHLGSRLQRAIEHGFVRKVYHALLCGDLREPVCVNQPIGEAVESLVHLRRDVRAGGQPATTLFTPLARSEAFTLAKVEPRTGRLHQIRVHAAWLGHAVAGDKIYGPDETLFLDFIAEGWTDRHAAMLPFPRQALHASEWSYEADDLSLSFRAPLPAEWHPLLDRMTPVVA
jgi:23S rRNA pseudouridine1911/1915/1917 synthase